MDRPQRFLETLGFHGLQAPERPFPAALATRFATVLTMPDARDLSAADCRRVIAGLITSNDGSNPSAKESPCPW
jgi:hypothetical protein